MTTEQKQKVEALAKSFTDAAYELVEKSIQVWNGCFSQQDGIDTEECRDYLIAQISKNPDVKKIWEACCSADF